jgi:hypothetical protein
MEYIKYIIVIKTLSYLPGHSFGRNSIRQISLFGSLCYVPSKIHWSSSASHRQEQEHQEKILSVTLINMELGVCQLVRT